MQVVIDLKKTTNVKNVAARFLHYRPNEIALPTTVCFYASTDGKKYQKVKTVAMATSKNDRHDAWIDIAAIDGFKLNARYIKVEADQDLGALILCDEVLVNARW